MNLHGANNLTAIKTNLSQERRLYSCLPLRYLAHFEQQMKLHKTRQKRKKPRYFLLLTIKQTNLTLYNTRSKKHQYSALLISLLIQGSRELLCYKMNIWPSVHYFRHLSQRVRLQKKQNKRNWLVLTPIYTWMTLSRNYSK